MADQDFATYYSERFEGQIQWHDDKASYNKRGYVWTQAAIIGFAALTTISTALAFRWQIAAVWAIPISTSALVTALTALQKSLQFQELWIAYRMVAEALRKEGHFHQFRLGEYGRTDDPDSLFVEKVEGILVQQNEAWAARRVAPG